MIENGYYIWLYVCDQELEEEWNKISQLPFNGQDKRGQELRHTLIRYLTSKGLRKDSAGISKLSEKDILAVENGDANVLFTKKLSLYPRLYQIIWEFDVYKKTETQADIHSFSELNMLKTQHKSLNEIFGPG
ncbi:MAG: hypothetical protein HC906_03650 [Bacteroidales bacterium]|nr:hypothetical protein [Bacteroidales bacterium]